MLTFTLVLGPSCGELGSAANQLVPFLMMRETPTPNLLLHPLAPTTSITPTALRAHDACPRQQRPCRRTIMDSPPDARRPGRLHRHADP